MVQKKWLTTKCFKCKKVIEEKEAFIIDEEQDLIFCSEECLYQHFSKPIETLEKEFLERRNETDIPRENFTRYEDCLNDLLEAPDEIWEDPELVDDTPVHQYIGEFTFDDQSIYYVAIVRMTNTTPSFVFLHFPTTDLKLVEFYRRGRLIYDKSQSELEIEASENDALSEGDELATRLFDAMLAVRSDKDIPPSEFEKYAHLRQETIEDSDEIWRSTDLQGDTIVSFIKEFSMDEGDGSYIVITIEDVVSHSHFILFSFPTNDSQLTERYRQGQSLNTENPVKQESH